VRCQGGDPTPGLFPDFLKNLTLRLPLVNASQLNSDLLPAAPFFNFALAPIPDEAPAPAPQPTLEALVPAPSRAPDYSEVPDYSDYENQGGAGDSPDLDSPPPEPSPPLPPPPSSAALHTKAVGACSILLLFAAAAAM